MRYQSLRRLKWIDELQNSHERWTSTATPTSQGLNTGRPTAAGVSATLLVACPLRTNVLLTRIGVLNSTMRRRPPTEAPVPGRLGLVPDFGA